MHTAYLRCSPQRSGMDFVYYYSGKTHNTSGVPDSDSRRTDSGLRGALAIDRESWIACRRLNVVRPLFCFSLPLAFPVTLKYSPPSTTVAHLPFFTFLTQGILRIMTHTKTCSPSSNLRSSNSNQKRRPASHSRANLASRTSYTHRTHRICTGNDSHTVYNGTLNCLLC